MPKWRLLAQVNVLAYEGVFVVGGDATDEGNNHVETAQNS